LWYTESFCHPKLLLYHLKEHGTAQLVKAYIALWGAIRKPTYKTEKLLQDDLAGALSLDIRMP